jgi:hypothetical protein
MKRIFYLLTTCLLFLQVPELAQQTQQDTLGTFNEFRVGQLDPQDTDIGTMFGFGFGNGIDDRLYWGIEGNYFWSSFIKSTTVPDSISEGTIISREEVELDFSTSILTLFFSFYYDYPMTQDNSFYFRASAGAGWEFMWSKEKNFVKNKTRKRQFNSPGFQLSAGLGLKISTTGIIFADIVYNEAIVKTGEFRTEEGLPVFEQIDISGFGVRIGLKLRDVKLF